MKKLKRIVSQQPKSKTLSKRGLAGILSLTLLFSSTYSASAFAMSHNQEPEIKDRYVEETSLFDPKAHNRLADLKKGLARGSLEKIQQEANHTTIRNEFLEFSVQKVPEDMEDSQGTAGRFTIGNIEGNPNYSSDNGKILLFGHPSPWSSYSTIRINDQNYIFHSNNTEFDEEALRATSEMLADGVKIQQTLQLTENPTTGIQDTVQIEYVITNKSQSVKDAGARIMLDTMLGNNDGAPFKVPSLGNVTYERELSGRSIPQYWQAFDDLRNPSVFSVGTFYMEDDRKPDKVQFASWGDIYDASNCWDYQINPNRSVTRDSAVAMYWAPTTLAPEESLTVRTYYGVGFTGGEGDASESVIIPNQQNQFCVLVRNAENGAVIGNAQIVMDGVTKTTDASGTAVFDMPTGGQKQIEATCDGYSRRIIHRYVQPGGSTQLSLTPGENNGPYVVSAQIVENGQEQDLLEDLAYFTSNPSKDPTNGAINIQISAEQNGGNEIVRYELLQDGIVKVDSTNGIFSIPAVFEPGKITKLNKFDAGKSVYARVVDSSGTSSEPEKLGLRISLPSQYSAAPETGSIKMGGKLEATIAENVPLLGGINVSMGFLDDFPVSIEQSADGKVKVAINKKASQDFGECKEAYQSLSDKAKRAQDIGHAFGGTPNAFGAGMCSLKCDVMGYGEGSVSPTADGSARLTVNVGLVMEVKGEYNYTAYTFIGIFPIYLDLGAHLGMTNTFSGTLLYSDGHLQFANCNDVMEPEVGIHAGAGVGVHKILSIGGEAALKLLYHYDFANQYQNLKLNGSMKLIAQAGILKGEINFGDQTWTLYDSNQRNLAARDDPSFSLYNPAIYQPMGRAYLNAPPRAAPSEEAIIANEFPNCQPKMVSVGNTPYLFWLKDLENRSDNNRTALVYASCEKGIWSDPVVVADDGTLDSAFDVASDGVSLYAVWENGSKIFADDAFDGLTGETLMRALAKENDIAFAEIDPDSGAVLSSTVSAQENCDMLPTLSVNAGEVSVAWIHNSSNDFFGNNGTNAIYTAALQNNAWNQTLAEETAMPVLSLDTGLLRGKTCVAYVKDSDQNLDTRNDRSVYLWDGISTKKISEGEQVVSSPKFAQLMGKDSLCWIQDTNIVYSEDGDALRFAVQNTEVSLSDDMAICACGDQACLVWPAIEPETGSHMLYAAKTEDEGWSVPYVLAQLESPVSSVSGYLNSDGNVALAYKESYPEADETEGASICFQTFSPESHIRLKAVDFDPHSVQPGEAFPLALTLTNTGATVLDTAYVDCGWTTESLPLNSLEIGETKEYLLEVTAPEDLEKEAFRVNVYTAGDESYSQQYAQKITLGGPDLKIQATQEFSGQEFFGNISVTNQSYFPVEDAVVRLRADSPDGAILYENSIGALGAKETKTVFPNLLRIAENSSIKNIYATVDSEKEESYQSNNMELLYVALLRDAEETEPEIIPVESIDIAPRTLTLKVGETFRLNAVIAPENATNQRILWTSDASNLVSIDSLGNLQAKGIGHATITATTEDGGKKAFCLVTVSASHSASTGTDKSIQGDIAPSASLLWDSATISVGGVSYFTVMTDASEAPKASPANPSVASVSYYDRTALGYRYQVTGVSPGKTSINLQIGNAVLARKFTATVTGAAASLRSDTTSDFTCKRGSAYCFKITALSGSAAVPSFTVGNGHVLKTQFVAKSGSDFYFRVWAIGKPGESTGVYTQSPGESPQMHCIITVN